MRSGQKDTFYTNTNQNSEISKRICDNIAHYSNQKITILDGKLAGDDSATIFKKSSGDFLPQEVKAIGEIFVDEYLKANHIINIDKTLVSCRSGEMAKIYWHYGMVFRDPYVQALESEKESKADTRIDQLRGITQKAHEVIRRSFGSSKINAVISRMRVALSYSILTTVEKYSKHKKDNSNRKSAKFYMPYLAVVAPTGLKGGLGHTITGLLPNEVLIYSSLNIDEIDAANFIIDSADFSDEKLISETIQSSVLDKVLNKDSPLTKELSFKSRMLDNATIEYTSNDPTLKNIDFVNGLKYRLNLRDSNSVGLSNTAYEKLRSVGVAMPLKYLYNNMPYSSFRNALEALRPAESQRRILYNKMQGVLSIKKGKLDLLSRYEVYKSFNFSLIRLRKDEQHVYAQRHIRYISASSEASKLERMYGSRSGRFGPVSLKGSNILLQRFLIRNGIPFTESDVYGLIKHAYTVMDLSNTTIIDMISNILVAISGTLLGVDEVAKSIAMDQSRWEDENVLSSIIATPLENLYLSVDGSEPIFIQMPGLHLSRSVVKLVKLIGLQYFMSMQVLDDYKYSNLVITPNSNTNKFLSKLRKYKRNMKTLLKMENIYDEMGLNSNWESKRLYDDHTDL
ncbi:RNA-dependent RNA polymerase [Halyomorpha halys reo-like associated virus 1]|nr:RNA-dependent RNA polymerase [Halyomorpha halys reo-like associated virus 1]